MKKRSAGIIVLFIILLMMMTTVFVVKSTFPAYADIQESYNAVEIGLEKQIYSALGRNIQNIQYLYNFDDSADYIYIEFEEDGYAILYKDNLELLEYSLDCTLRDFGINSNSKNYYAGPSNYFVKSNKKYVNLISGDPIELTDAELKTNAQSIRNNFAQKVSTVNLNTDNLDNYIQNFDVSNSTLNTASVPDYDGLIELSGAQGTYIENSGFFLANPYHGENVDGTCGSVATQLLLDYHNYYSDRRIINNSYLFPEVEDNPNTCTDPMSMARNTLGSTDAYYNYIMGKVEIKVLGGSTTVSIKNGIDDILSARGIDYTVEQGDSVVVATSPSNIRSSIDANRPIIVTLSGLLGGTDKTLSGHVVVAYGYRDYTYSTGEGTYSGYIVHYGWATEKEPDGIRAWVNSEWCNGYVSLKINHTHNYDTFVGGEHQEVKCSTCGHRRYFFITRDISNTEVEITGYYNIVLAITIPSAINGKIVRAIGEEAFIDCNGLISVTFPNTITEIKDRAFARCKRLKYMSLPTLLQIIGAGVFMECEALEDVAFGVDIKKIGSGAFLGSGIEKITFTDSSTTTTSSTFEEIGIMAFAGCSNLTNVSIPEVRTIEQRAFASCSALEHVNMKGVQSIGTHAFDGCDNLTIYTTRNNDSGWNSQWNNANRPVVWGCDIKNDVVKNFLKSSTNPTNAVDAGEPLANDYNFGGWYTDSNYTSERYWDIASAPNGRLYAKWNEKSSGSCITADTQITLADGSQKAVEDLTGDEQLLVWNLLTGTFDVAPILFIDSDPAMLYEAIKLTFSDGTVVKVIDEHAFWDFDLNEYVFLRSDATQYIGHFFNKQTLDENNNLVWNSVQLISVDIIEEYTTAWSPVTYGQLCYYVNGMLSMPGATEGLINIFEVDPTTMKYDETQMAEDIATYGLYTYEEFCAEIAEIPEVIFEAFNGQYLKVSIGKGLIEVDGIISLVERYADFFN